MAASWKRKSRSRPVHAQNLTPQAGLVRFVPKSNPSRTLVGQPTDESIDVGLAVHGGQEVPVSVFSGSSVLDAGHDTGVVEAIGQILSPVTQQEAGAIRCIGLNYKQHAAEAKLDLPTLPTVFLKPQTALAGPWPQPTLLPKLTQADDCGDYESELAVIIGKAAKNVSEAEALDYVLGYTSNNDVSSRTPQFGQSQWSFSKGFDTACPIGPTVVSPALVPDPSKLHIRGIHNGKVMQDCPISDLVFGVPKLISFLSQGTTLPAGTVIVTGTPAGVGFPKKPKVTLKDGDEFRVEILPHVGTLVNRFQNERSTT